MKGFAKIALTVALTAVIVLSIVVASVAWFTSNPQVDASDVTLTSSRTLTVSFGPYDDDPDNRYRGQWGSLAEGEEDAPYVHSAGGFTLNLNSLSSDRHYGKVQVQFGTVNILTETVGPISGVLITDLFHVTADVYVRNDSGTYVKDATTHRFRTRVAEDGEALRYNKAFSDLTVADDGILMQTVNETTSFAAFREGVYEIAFSYTFLPEAAYAVWERANAEPPTASFSEIYGYEMVPNGSYVGVVSYTAYKAKYHYGLTRYNKSATADGNGNYTYTADEEGAYVKAITAYTLIADVTKYTSALGAGEGASNGTYIKVGDSGEYVLFSRYNQVNGFPYQDDKYLGERFTFTIACSVEEEVVNA